MSKFKKYLAAILALCVTVSVPAASAQEINLLANPGHLSFYESGVTTEQEHSAILQSAQIWNTLAGRPVIVINPPNTKIDFVITPVLGFDDDNALGVTHFFYNTRYVSYHVLLRASPEALRKVITHEFGHALGLDHSENKESVMYASYTGAEFPDLEDVRKVRKMWTY
jgi:hypothetical protein